MITHRYYHRHYDVIGGLEQLQVLLICHAMVLLFHIYLAHCFVLCLRGIFITLKIVTD